MSLVSTFLRREPVDSRISQVRARSIAIVKEKKKSKAVRLAGKRQQQRRVHWLVEY